MLGSVRDSEFDVVQKTPNGLGGNASMSVYVIASNVDEHCAQARAAGAKTMLDPADKDYRGRFYSCFDIEGRLWNRTDHLEYVLNCLPGFVVKSSARGRRSHFCRAFLTPELVRGGGK
jgi:hypothetical protein